MFRQHARYTGLGRYVRITYRCVSSWLICVTRLERLKTFLVMFRHVSLGNGQEIEDATQ